MFNTVIEAHADYILNMDVVVDSDKVRVIIISDDAPFDLIIQLGPPWVMEGNFSLSKLSDGICINSKGESVVLWQRNKAAYMWKLNQDTDALEALMKTMVIEAKIASKFF